MRTRVCLAALVFVASVGCVGERAPFDPDAVSSTATKAVTSTTTLTPIADTHIRSGSPNQNYGTTTTLIVEKNGSKRALVKFDTAAIQAALVGRTLVSASFVLTIQNSASGFPTGGANLAAHRLTQDWTEGGATWNCAIDSILGNSQPDCPTDAWSMGAAPYPWADPGVTTLIIAGQTGVIAFDVTANVAAFADGAETNHGWLVKKESESLNGTVTFRSRQGTIPPRLVLTLAGPCGDGTIDPQNGEECDDGNTTSGDGCNASCVVEYCGDGVVNNSEGCDDANTTSGDGCSAACVVEYCGDGLVNNGGEECDDGNTTSGDGCNAGCFVEWCGDGIVNNDEECDDGNVISGDGCSAICVVEYCGDGVVNDGVEDCDDGNTAAGDGCDSVCVAEFCGDGTANDVGREQCDDGNADNYDGCTGCLRDGVIQSARRDVGLQAPACLGPTISCASTIANGRGPNETNQPNTLGNSCPDGMTAYISGVANLTVATADQSLLAAGKTIAISAYVGIISTTNDYVDFFAATDAYEPSWILIDTIAATSTGTYSMNYVLPSGSVQAVRVQHRNGGEATPCMSGSLNDRDDLAFKLTGNDFAPTGIIASPVDGASTSSPLRFTAQAVDDIGISRVEFFSGGQLLCGATMRVNQRARWSCVSRLVSLSGVISVRALVTDRFNQQSTSTPIALTITNPDTGPPQIVVISPSSGGYYSAGTMSLAANTVDADDNITRVDFFVDDVNVGFDTTSPYSISWETTGVAVGNHEFTASATNARGYTTPSEIISAYIDPP